MKRFTAIIFVGVLGMLMCMVFAGVSMKAAEKIAATSKTVNIDWEKLYPFEESADHVPEPKTSLFAYVKQKVGKYTSGNMAGGFSLVEAARAYEELIGWNMAALSDYNPVIKLNDGYLSGLVTSRDISENAEAVKELDSFCRALGIEYAYINYPAKMCVSLDKDISGILDFSNQNADNLLGMLRDSGVRVYDFRELLHREGMNHHEAFFRTDHHWKPETGLWAARHIVRILRDDYGLEVEPEILNPDRFEYKVSPDWFLGSQGKKLTLARTKADDFTMIYPKFRTCLRFEVPSLGIDASGDFAVTYDFKKVATRDYYNLTPSGAYNHGRNPICRLENIIADKDNNVLLIYDSFSNSVIPFLALAVKHIDVVDLRQFSGSLRSYIKALKPDIVITVYYAKMPGYTLSSSYPENKLYDFR